jgi:hypothetical protein
MQIFKSIALGVTIFALAGGAALAEGDAMMKNDGAMKSGAMMSSDHAMKTDSMMAAKPMAMSAKDTKKMAACKAMTPDKMIKDVACAKMAKMHPEMMSAGGPMTTNGMRK